VWFFEGVIPTPRAFTSGARNLAWTTRQDRWLTKPALVNPEKLNTEGTGVDSDTLMPSVVRVHFEVGAVLASAFGCLAMIRSLILS